VCPTCNAGKYAADQFGDPVNIAAVECKNCSAGTYSISDGSSDCEVCSEGKYSYEGLTICSSCVAGTYASDVSGNGVQSGAVMCKDCPVNTYSESAQSTQCEDCDVGWASLPGSNECTECLEGTYAMSTGLCEPCAAGKYSQSSASTSCTPCAAGKFSESSASVCSLCPGGRVSSEESSSECTECPAGKYARTGVSECSSCGFAEMSGRGASSCDSQFAFGSFQADQAFFFYGFVLVLIIAFTLMYCYCRRRCKKASGRHHNLETTTPELLMRDSSHEEEKQQQCDDKYVSTVRSLDLETATKQFGDDMKCYPDIVLSPGGNNTFKVLKFELQANESMLWTLQSMSNKVLVKRTWNGETKTMKPNISFKDFLKNEHNFAGTLSIRVSCRKNITSVTRIKMMYHIIRSKQKSSSSLPIALSISSDELSAPPPPTGRNDSSVKRDSPPLPSPTSRHNDDTDENKLLSVSDLLHEI